jgi:hypothetical protein
MGDPGCCVELDHQRLLIPVEDEARQAIVLTVNQPVAGGAGGGWPVTEGRAAGGGSLQLSREPRLLDGGRFVPARTRDDAIERIDAMCRDLEAYIWEHLPARVVIEISSGKTAKRHGGAGAGLAIYGQAVGELRRQAIVSMNQSVMQRLCVGEASLAPPHQVISVKENDWTRGVPKRTRAARIAAEFPAYAAAVQGDPAGDRGGDVADAIGLGVWWFETQELTDIAFRQDAIE